MRVTIVPFDGFVSVDGEGYRGIDLSSMPSDIHAVQWYGEEGEIERTNAHGKVIANEAFFSLTQFDPALRAWADKKTSEAENLAVDSEQSPLPKEPS